MSTAYASTRQRRPAQLPLGLQPYHLTFAVYLTSIVLLGTVYSITYGTHLQNVRISSGAASQFPSTLPGAAVAPAASVRNGADGSTTDLGPIPPTILLPPGHVLNYWANRRNIVNQIFVKKAWFWTTVAWALQLFFLRLAPSNPSVPASASTANAAPGPAGAAPSARVGSRVQGLDHKKDEDATVQPTAAPTPATITSPVSISVLRYLVATAAWLLFANWFFGPPLTERILTATGAVCVLGTDAGQPTVENLYCHSRKPLTSSTHPALFPSSSSSSSSSKAFRAMWKGGHDISGHTFIMVLSSLLLLEDIAPYLANLASTSAIGRKLFPPTAGRAQLKALNTTPGKVAIGATLALLALWSWMLLNTAIYFHTPQEKISGLLVAFLAWLLLPKGC